MTTPRIEFSRAGAAAFGWLAHAIAEAKHADPLAPVTLVPPNMPAGRMALRHLAATSGYVNVRVTRLAEIASTIARPLLLEREPLTPVLESSAARSAAAAVPALRPLAGHLALTQSLVRLFRELRRSELRADDERWHDAGPMARAALDAYQIFRELTAEFVDSTDVRLAAAERLAESAAVPELSELGSIVVFLPSRLDAADERLLQALAKHIGISVLFPDVCDPQELAGQRAIDSHFRLTQALRVFTLDGGPSVSYSLALPAETSIVRAPDPAEEVREIVRAVVASMESGVSLPRLAVLYRQSQAYGPVLRDALDLAGLPWYCLSGTPVGDSRPAKLLLDLLRLPERSFGREAVLQVIANSPAFRQSAQPAPATWERLSRDANVVRGVDQWTTRLRRHADSEEARLALTQSAEGGNNGATTHTERARQIAETMQQLADSLRTPDAGASWLEFATWADTAFERYCGAAELWPEDERPFVHDVRKILLDLADASRFETSTSLPLFLAALEDALGSATRPPGQLGTGIVIGPVQSVGGMSFERVFLVGLTEGAFPPSPPVDPFFPTEAEDLLGLRQQYREREREAFLMAIAAAERGLTLSTPQSAEGRAAFPSRWLLEVASSLPGGQGLNASRFAALSGAGHPWLRIVRSPGEGVRTGVALADLEDRRLAEAGAWTLAGRRLSANSLAQRPELPLGRALAATAARRSHAFTEFDGNVEELAGQAAAIARLSSGERVTSATAVQEWASCPFSYLLHQVLRVRPTEAPEDRWTIDAAARGTLVHSILEQFLRRQADAEPPLGIRPYNEADRQLLRNIAEAEFDELRASGQAGNPLIWEAVAADVWADLEMFLREDQMWRAEHGWRPARFEQSFGFDEPDSWPVLDLTVNGLSMRFRGQIDRIDLAADGRRVFLYDYKTGRSQGYEAVELDPVNAGQALQLALYAEAGRRNLGQPEIEAAYWFVSSRGGFAMHGLKQPGEQVTARLHEVLGHIAAGIQEGVFPAVPGEENEYYGGFANCGWCPYDRVCPNARDQLWLAKRETPGGQRFEALQLSEVPA